MSKPDGAVRLSYMDVVDAGAPLGVECHNVNIGFAFAPCKYGSSKKRDRLSGQAAPSQAHVAAQLYGSGFRWGIAEGRVPSLWNICQCSVPVVVPFEHPATGEGSTETGY